MVRLESEAAAAADGDVFAALAHPVRRKILMRLRAGAHTASDLAADMPIGRPAVSEHLQALRLAKLVKVERRGRERYYFLDPRPLTELARGSTPCSASGRGGWMTSTRWRGGRGGSKARFCSRGR